MFKSILSRHISDSQVEEEEKDEREKKQTSYLRSFPSKYSAFNKIAREHRQIFCKFFYEFL